MPPDNHALWYDYETEMDTKHRSRHWWWAALVVIVTLAALYYFE
ncbi:hypothetical protein BGCPKDLD_5098 [Methylorubrum suomiense]|uniref:Uncharacterized protein n=1 Tax=Methylorubrum suomiense TaxID=144191 RepID=A0ABQ4V699_9HYPH|nr:hypothetical protein BGCPKDLD_5098 [Methylorubrum suomiense]